MVLGNVKGVVERSRLSDCRIIGSHFGGPSDTNIHNLQPATDLPGVVHLGTALFVTRTHQVCLPTVFLEI